MHMNDEWLDQHQAAAVSGYNARSLRNMANQEKIAAEKRSEIARRAATARWTKPR